MFCNLYERRNEMKVNYQLEGKEQKHHNIYIKLNRNYIKQDLQHELWNEKKIHNYIFGTCLKQESRILKP